VPPASQRECKQRRSSPWESRAKTVCLKASRIITSRELRDFFFRLPPDQLNAILMRFFSHHCGIATLIAFVIPLTLCRYTASIACSRNGRGGGTQGETH
jgi:hypothetical protein